MSHNGPQKAAHSGTHTATKAAATKTAAKTAATKTSTTTKKVGSTTKKSVVRRHLYHYTVSYRSAARHSRTFASHAQAHHFYHLAWRLGLNPRMTRTASSTWRVSFGRSSWHRYMSTSHHPPAVSAYNHLRAHGLHARISTRRIY
jgi:hypothetical protein